MYYYIKRVLNSNLSNMNFKNFFKENNINPNSKIGLEITKVYDDTQNKLRKDLDSLKEKVVEIATRDFGR